MTESQNKQRRPSGQARGLRARSRTRSDNQNPQQARTNSNNANRQRKPDGVKNGAKPAQRRKPARPRGPNTKLDSELDFRNTRPSALQQQNSAHHDSPLFSQNSANGNRASAHRRGKPMKNGQNWTPADSGGIYLHESRSSDWYREDQARYAAKQIALENAEQRNRDPQRRNANEAGQPKRPQPQRNRNRNNNPNNNNRPRQYPRRTEENGSPVAATSSSATQSDSPNETAAPICTPAPVSAKSATTAKSETPPSENSASGNGVSTESKPVVESAQVDTAVKRSTETAKKAATEKAATEKTERPKTQKSAAAESITKDKPAPRKRAVKAKESTTDSVSPSKAKSADSEAKPKPARKATTTRTRKPAQPKSADKPDE